MSSEISTNTAHTRSRRASSFGSVFNEHQHIAGAIGAHTFCYCDVHPYVPVSDKTHARVRWRSAAPAGVRLNWPPTLRWSRDLKVVRA